MIALSVPPGAESAFFYPTTALPVPATVLFAELPSAPPLPEAVAIACCDLVDGRALTQAAQRLTAAARIDHARGPGLLSTGKVMALSVTVGASRYSSRWPDSTPESHARRRRPCCAPPAQPVCSARSACAGCRGRRQRSTLALDACSSCSRVSWLCFCTSRIAFSTSSSLTCSFSARILC